MNKVKIFHISLNKDQAAQLDFKGKKELYLECLEGSAWMTIKDDAEDYIVSAGENISVENRKDELVLESVSERLEIEVWHFTS
jgi:hypothetical protein